MTYDVIRQSHNTLYIDYIPHTDVTVNVLVYGFAVHAAASR